MDNAAVGIHVTAVGMAMRHLRGRVKVDEAVRSVAEKVEQTRAFGTNRGCARLCVQRRPRQERFPADEPSDGLATQRTVQYRRNEGMRPAGWSSHPADDGTLTLVRSDVQALEMATESVPAECPGVVLEQPLERWSPRDLVAGLFRLVRWSRLATS
jgi:proteasome lid subunit RPN8/RPN11